VYNATASSTYTADPQNRLFNATYSPYGPSSWYWYYNLGNGSVVSDTVNIGGVNVNMNFGDLTYIEDELDYWMPVDGILGISPNTSNNGIPSAMSQLMASLDQPVVTMYVNRSYEDWQGKYSTAQILFGSNQLAQCNQKNWVYYNARTDPSVLTFYPYLTQRVKSISTSNSVSHCNTQYTANHTLNFAHSFNKMRTSIQVLQMFVDVSGAVYNNTYYRYTVDCGSVANAGNVNVNMDDGSVIVLTPKDYIIQAYGMCWLNVRGSYDENDPYYGTSDYYGITIGEQYMNSRCYSYNYKDNTVAITDALPQQ